MEAAEVLAKATGACVTDRALGVCEQSKYRPLRGLPSRTVDTAPGVATGRAVGEEVLAAVAGRFLRGALEATRRCCQQDILGCEDLSLDKCTPDVHLDMRIRSRILRVVRVSV